MNDVNQYRVLWVDEEIDSQFVDMAARYGLEVVQYTSWERGRDALCQDGAGWDAVILDGRSVLMEGEEPSSDFLYQAVSEMKESMAAKGLAIPWYVMSSGSAEDFDKTLSRIELGERKRQRDRWGRMAYGKTAEERDQLLTAICKAAAQSVESKIRFMYADVFETLGQYFDQRATEVMLTILTALHFPEEDRKFSPVAYYTQLRRILEYLFRAANRLGLLPDELLHGDKVNLTNSSCYLDGQIVKADDHTTLKLKGFDARIFPPIIAGIVKKIINVANKETHTTDITQEEESILRDYYVQVGAGHMLFGYALQLCDVITWFGYYAKAHPNVLENRQMHSVRARGYQGSKPATKGARPRPQRPEKKGGERPQRARKPKGRPGGSAAVRDTGKK